MGIALLNWTCEFCLPCGQVKHCIVLYYIMYFLWFFFIIVNRSMTLYISYVRAWSLKNVTNAMKNLEKSHCRVLTELACFTAISSVPQFLILIPGKVVIPHWSKLNPHTVLAWGVIVYCTSWIIIELILASFVLVKLRIRQQSKNRNKPMDDSFEKLVALVALVFCCCLVVNVIDFALRLNAKDELEFWQGGSAYWSIIAAYCNSSINLFVYLLASQNFRAAFVSLCKKCCILL